MKKTKVSDFDKLIFATKLLHLAANYDYIAIELYLSSNQVYTYDKNLHKTVMFDLTDYSDEDFKKIDYYIRKIEVR